jgi:predicted Asp-tRNA(Asn)/Glu-tRNA(Gln) amidotransferase subunit C
MISFGVQVAERKLKEIERSAEEIVESFVEAAEELPELRETYYSQESYNVVRPDGEPSREKERAEFRKRFISIMPGVDDQGNLRVEVAKWAGER